MAIQTRYRKIEEMPKWFKPESVNDRTPVNYAELWRAAAEWRERHRISLSFSDKLKIVVWSIDEQLTFCHPDFELVVADAPEDIVRGTRWFYQHIALISSVVASLDTHKANQIFHATAFLNGDGSPLDARFPTEISAAEFEAGVFLLNPDFVRVVKGPSKEDFEYMQAYVQHYLTTVEEKLRFKHTVWQFHSMLASQGHALSPMVEASFQFFGMVRGSEPQLLMKGTDRLSESFSVYSPEVLVDHLGQTIARRNEGFLKTLVQNDIVVVRGQAKSHCVAWTIRDVLDKIERDPLLDNSLKSRIYLLEDCTSPVVVPGVVDWTEDASRSFREFGERGVHLVTSTTPMTEWPGVAGERLIMSDSFCP